MAEAIPLNTNVIYLKAKSNNLAIILQNEITNKMTTLLTRILLELEVPHTKSFSDNLYNEHPYRYTLYGIQQMLSRYNIKTTTVRLKAKEDFQRLTHLF